jgi:dTDP-glucose 4,6-dehydratase
MVLNAVEAKDLPVYGDGLQVRDWIYVDDHCAGVKAALEKGLVGKQYLFGGRSERTNMQVLEAILAGLEEVRPASSNAALQARGYQSYRQLITRVKDRPGHDRRYAIDPSFAEKELAWKPDHLFEAGIRETVRWYLDHQEWCTTVQKDNYNRGRLGTI